jgi:hypothetical protein
LDWLLGSLPSSCCCFEGDVCSWDAARWCFSSSSGLGSFYELAAAAGAVAAAPSAGLLSAAAAGDCGAELLALAL